jgi:hypothetical protein
MLSELDETTIKQRVLEIFDRFDFDYEISWRLSGNPFLTSGGTLIEAAHTAIKKVTGLDTSKRSNISSTRCLIVVSSNSVQKRKLNNSSSSPGIIFSAPVPALILDICKLVGGKN